MRAALPLALSFAAAVCTAQDEAVTNPGLAGTGTSLYLKLELPTTTKIGSLKAGDYLTGTLARDVFTPYQQLLSAGTPVTLTVDHMEQLRRPRNDRWPWVIQVFTPRHQRVPVFKPIRLTLLQGGEADVRASLLSAARKKQVHAQKSKRSDSGDKTSAKTTPAASAVKSNALIMTLQAIFPASPASATAANDPAQLPENSTLPAGTQCKVVLLGSLTASRNHAGDVIEASLLEPLRRDSRTLLPAGTVFHGSVVKAIPPRRFSRSGSLFLKFTSLRLPDGSESAAAASLVNVEIDRASHTRLDAEGRLRGERPGAAWMLINTGVTAGIAKEVDDGAQLIVEALISTATDASTAGTARIVSTAISGIFMATRRGRDVVLPQFTEMDLSLDRPLTLSRAPATALNTSPPHVD